MNKILKFNNAILNLDNLEVIEIEKKYNDELYRLHFTTCIVQVNLTEEEFQYLTEFLKSDFKFHEINKPVNRINNNINEINNNIKEINNNIKEINNNIKEIKSTINEINNNIYRIASNIDHIESSINRINMRH